MMRPGKEVMGRKRRSRSVAIAVMVDLGEGGGGKGTACSSWEVGLVGDEDLALRGAVFWRPKRE